MTTDGKRIYFADSETSAIRWADFETDGRVGTIIGKGLFEFGDKDGKASQARLQHPLGVVYHDGLLYVADTYNSGIKVVHPVEFTSKSFAGGGKPGFQDGESSEARFNEPGGITRLGKRLYIADTNNHRIRIIELESGVVSTLKISK